MPVGGIRLQYADNSTPTTEMVLSAAGIRSLQEEHQCGVL